MGYKFNGKRYITRGINNTLPIDIQLILFQSIELMRGKELLENKLYNLDAG